MVTNTTDLTHHQVAYCLLAVEALCWLFDSVNEERVRDLRPTLEGAVYPEWPPTPHLRGVDEQWWVGHAICILQSSAVVRYPICTLLVVVLITP